MHEHQLSNWQHPHNFARINRKNEVRAKYVLLLTVVTMLAEIVAGLQFHSMALQADGWHMATHAVAFMIALFAYRYGRIHEQDQTFAFSPAKVSVLGGFASSIALAMVALMMVAESARHLLRPEAINFDDALIVASIGLTVNLISALLLMERHEGHSHSHGCSHGGGDAHTHHHDHNLRAAYLHVLADALTSVLAITALLAGKYYAWNMLDPLMGFVGAVIILVWSRSLVRETSPILLDQNVGEEYRKAIRNTLEADGESLVSDLHIWRLGARHQAAIVVVITRFPKPPSHYKAMLANFVDLDHITVEVNCCVGEDCLAQ